MSTLKGFTVIEMAGIGPGPMAGMMFADMGANVIRVERGTVRDFAALKDASFRGKKCIILDLKQPEGKETLLKMVEQADVLIEGYRPGVAESLGIGPDVCLARNPKLVYGRMTGWGQDGPLAKAAGHDINYISLTGALFATGRSGERPVPPLNLVGDMGGGGMLLVVGVLAALLEAQKSGAGQIVDAAMVDGAAQLMWMFHGLHAAGFWNAEDRGVNLLDGGTHFYDTYETKDGKYISIGSLEPQFNALLIDIAGLDPVRFGNHMDGSKWPELTQELMAVFKTKTQQEWCSLMEGTDVCFAPVLSLTEAPDHPHNKVRGTYIDLDGFKQPAPAPRFSKTPSTVKHGQHKPGEDNEEVLKAMGFDEQYIANLKAKNIIKQ
jgi:alpha-methylacyl-CoA racemase